MTNTSGTAAAFRTNRTLTLSGSSIAVVVNNNATATFTVSGGGNFTGVQVGDNVFIPTTSTGDSGPFNALNGGFWSVIKQTTSVLTLIRLPGVSFSALAESVTLTTNTQLVAFTNAGVQVGDTLEVSAGFSTVTQKAFVVTNVTPTWVEFISAESLPLETGISPTSAGLTFYNHAKRYLRIEADQEIVVRFNGETSNTLRVSPRVAGDLRSGFGFLTKWGPTWSLEVVNRSKTANVNLVVIAAE